MNAKPQPILSVIEYTSTFFLILLLFFISTQNYLLFHSISEIFSIIIAAVVFLITWLSKDKLENNYLKFLGISLLFILSIDFLHILAYQGMGVFPEHSTDLSVQLWILARYMQAISLLVAPFMFKIRARTWLVGTVYIIVSALLLYTIFVSRTFPTGYIEGVGLTPFKVYSEYLISGILATAFYLLHRQRSSFPPQVYMLLSVSIIAMILSELSFTLYVDVYGFFNTMGHFFKITEFYLIYKAIVKMGIEDPYQLIFSELVESKEKLRQSEEMFRGIADNSVDAIAIVDQNGIVSYMSPSIEQILGYPPDVFVGHHFTDFINEEEVMSFIEYHRDIISFHNTGSMQMMINDANGVSKWIEINSSPLTKDGLVVSIESIIRDITERKNLQTQLQDAFNQLENQNERLMQLGEMKERFVSTATHELRTPLTSISLSLEVIGNLNKESWGNEEKKMHEVLERNTDRLVVLTDDLLDVQRMVSGRLIINLVSVNVSELLNEVIEEMMPLIARKNQKLVEEIEDGIPVFQGDKTRLSQVIVNLISNANKFTPEGGTITIKARLKEGSVEVSVSDTGIGLLEEDIEKLFSPFPDIVAGQKFGGSGLGLSISKGIIELHKGEIWAESAGLEQGSTFCFTLPVISSRSL